MLFQVAYVSPREPAKVSMRSNALLEQLRRGRKALACAAYLSRPPDVAFDAVLVDTLDGWLDLAAAAQVLTAPRVEWTLVRG